LREDVFARTARQPAIEKDQVGDQRTRRPQPFLSGARDV
jgi:hypothetical protein